MSDFDTPPLNQCRVAWGLGKGEGDCIWTLGSQGIIRPNQMRRRRRRRKPQKPLCSTSMIFVSWSCFGKTGMTNIAFDDFFHRLVLNPFHQCLLVVNQKLPLLSKSLRSAKADIKHCSPMVFPLAKRAWSLQPTVT